MRNSFVTGQVLPIDPAKPFYERTVGFGRDSQHESAQDYQVTFTWFDTSINDARRHKQRLLGVEQIGGGTPSKDTEEA